MRRSVDGSLDPGGAVSYEPPVDVAVVEERLMERSSSHLTFQDGLTVRDRLERAGAEGFDGAVLVQGTDTLAEMAYLLELTGHYAGPVVVTGAMRLPEQPGFDGPANVRAAVAVAASSWAQGLGVLVVMGDKAFAAGDVEKAHGYLPDAFESPWGPLGEIREGEFLLHRRPLPGTPLRVGGIQARVHIAYVAFDDPGVLRPYLQDPPDGLVIAGFGGGHLPPAVLADLRELLAHRVAVWVVPRRGAHPLHRTYTSRASEIALQELGVRMEDGPPEKARLRLLVQIAARSAEEGESHG